jgi:hypothetical protein
VTGAKIFDGTIGLLDMGANAVDAGVLADNSVDSSAIVNGTIALGDMGTNAVDSNVIVDQSIAGADLRNGAVDKNQIAGGAVGTSELATDAVKALQIAAGAVDTSELADNAVTNIKMADDAIHNAEIQNDAVTGSKIQDGSLTSSDIAAVNGSTPLTGTVMVDPPSLAAGTCGLPSPAPSIAGTQAADKVILNLDDTGISPSLSYQPMTPGSSGGFRVRFCNLGAGTVDDPPLRFSYVVIR